MQYPHISHRGHDVIASPIRKFLPLIRRAEKRGITVYKLNTGDPDSAVPKEFYHAIRAYRQKNLGYAPSPGYPEHIAAWQAYYRQFGFRLNGEHIIPTVGCAEAILLALMAVADAGDEILVFEPLYVSYKSFATMVGIKLVPITLKTENDFALPPLASIERKINNKTKAIVIINPDNPTGKLWNKPELKTLAAIALNYGLFIISDETYREIRFTGRPECLLKNAKTRQHIILVDSVSKRFSLPGARIGCVASFNREVMTTVLKFAQARLSTGTLEQFGVVPLLEHSTRFTNPLRDEYKRRRDVICNALSTMPGVHFSKPGGAFYVYAKLPIDSAEEFVKFLISDFAYQGQTVMISPMQDFYITPGLGIDEIRIAYVLNCAKLKKAMGILARGLEAYRKQQSTHGKPTGKKSNPTVLKTSGILRGT